RSVQTTGRTKIARSSGSGAADPWLTACPERSRTGCPQRETKVACAAGAAHFFWHSCDHVLVQKNDVPRSQRKAKQPEDSDTIMMSYERAAGIIAEMLQSRCYIGGAWDTLDRESIRAFLSRWTDAMAKNDEEGTAAGIIEDLRSHPVLGEA